MPQLPQTLTDMTVEEATAKHAQLKSLSSVMRSLLLEMRDRHGYIALGFSTFEEYGEKEWGYTRTYINRLANAEKIQQSLSVPIGTELPESQLRELAKIPEAERQRIYDQAKAEAEAENKEITAKAIREKAEAEQRAKTMASTNTQLVQENKMLCRDIEELKESFESEREQLKIEVNNSKVKLNYLQDSIESNAEKIAEKKIAEKQLEMQENLDQMVLQIESENQAAISDLNITILRLKQEKADWQKNHPEPNCEKREKLSSDLAKAEAELEELLAKKAEAEIALQKLDFESQEYADAKLANHAMYGAIWSIYANTDVHVKQVESFCYVDDDKTKCHYPLTDRTKKALTEIAQVLKLWANTFETLAGDAIEHVNELDAIN